MATAYDPGQYLRRGGDCQPAELWPSARALATQPRERFLTLRHPNNFNAPVDSPGRMAVPAGSSRRMHRLDGHPRRSISRAAPVLPAGVHPRKESVPAEVLLFVYL